jgi:hypothetical protein
MNCRKGGGGVMGKRGTELHESLLHGAGDTGQLISEALCDERVHLRAARCALQLLSQVPLSTSGPPTHQ